ncbi:hypothetical protein [Actinomadura madurae]|uniref:hypothetical protein n=1 Tax=Actinomadura madurae TaxID=1993 RepID=UPI0020D25365|nr:hypothetical protein [Actinomadura madurae]MCP9982059.1 hypothetical protein [Actinomadura madurae]
MPLTTSTPGEGDERDRDEQLRRLLVLLAGQPRGHAGAAREREDRDDVRAVDQQQRQRVVGVARLGQALGQRALERVEDQDHDRDDRVGDREQPGGEPDLHVPRDQLDHAEREPHRPDQRRAELHHAEQQAVESGEEADAHGQQGEREPDLGERPGDQIEQPVLGGALNQQPGRREGTKGRQ